MCALPSMIRRLSNRLYFLLFHSKGRTALSSPTPPNHVRYNLEGTSTPVAVERGLAPATAVRFDSRTSTEEKAMIQAMAGKLGYSRMARLQMGMVASS
jgi:hypothetical protein